ncbi:MAG: ABC transporter permease [Clostridiaceae bacterium]|nr:ABC transporter permease [Clostridiaceae bacterium]
MKTYYSVFKMRLINSLQYRTAAFAGVATQFFWGFMLIMIYEAFFQNGDMTQPISLNQVIDYIWLQQAFLVFVALWYRDGELFNLITSGNVAYELCRPCDLYGFWYARLIAQRIAGALLRCFPILIIAFLLPEPYKLSMPGNPATMALFTVTLILGLMVLVSISMLIYISVFITMSPTGSMLMIGVLGDFLAGMILPIPLMPEWLQKIAYILPFRLAADLPFRVYSGNIPINEAVSSVFIQLAWLIVLVLSGRFLLEKVLKRVVIQGG